MCTLSPPVRVRGQRSYPQIVCTASDGTCVCRVPSNKRWPRTMLRPVVELGGDEFPSPNLPPPQHRCANPITPGRWRRERSCSPGSAAAVPKFDGVLRGAAAAATPRVWRSSPTPWSMAGYDQRSYVR